MDLNRQKEQFSNAHLTAVVAAAGYNVYKPQVDDDSVDWGIGARGGRGTIRSPRMELQLKSTSRDIVREDHVAFPLEMKNYDELRFQDYQVPRILVVVILPEEVQDWISQSEQEMLIRHCGYWLSLRGEPEVSNQETITVHLPRDQQFTVDALTDMMRRIEGGQFP